MLRFIVIFLVLALIAGIFGFHGFAGNSMEMAKVLGMIFVGLLVVALITGRRSTVV